MSPTTLLVSALIFAVVLALLWKLTRRKEEKPWIQAASCPACGWQGRTSRYAGRCPKCNAPVGEQRAKRTQR